MRPHRLDAVDAAAWESTRSFRDGAVPTQAFASSLDHPDEVDAKCVDGKRHACKLPPPSCVGIVNDFNSGLKAKARIDGKFLDDKDYRNHKYLLNLPGAASGSYSKNLNHLWRTGSVVMQWVHPFVEWYRPVRKSSSSALQFWVCCGLSEVLLSVLGRVYPSEVVSEFGPLRGPRCRDSET